MDWSQVPAHHPAALAAMSDDELGMVFKEAVYAARTHDPEQQDHGYKGRCGQCGFVRTPCQTASLAWDVLRVLRMMEELRRGS